MTKKLDEKGMELNLYLKELTTDKNIFSRLSSNNLVISKVLHWQIDSVNSDAKFDECNFKNDLTVRKYDKCNITPKTKCSDNVKKIVFAHLNINSIRNKF